MNTQPVLTESEDPTRPQGTPGVTTGHPSLTGRWRIVRPRRPTRRPGVAAIEFALVAPMFLLFVFGLVELGRMLMVQQSLTNAAREGCRTAVMATTVNSSDVDNSVRDYLQSIVANASNTSQVRVTVPASLANCASGTELTVAVEVDYADVSWIPTGFLGVNPKIGAEQTGRRE